MQEKKYVDIIQDIEDTLCSTPDYFVKNIYVMVVGKNPQLRNNIEIIMEALSEVDEEFLCEVYTKVLNKECQYSHDNNVYIIY